jgi:hypothetical protein
LHLRKWDFDSFGRQTLLCPQEKVAQNQKTVRDSQRVELDLPLPGEKMIVMDFYKYNVSKFIIYL